MLRTSELFQEQPEDGFREALALLEAAVEAKDFYTALHVRRVASYSELIALHMGLGESAVREVRLAAMLHDLGKIGVCDRVLQKAGPLDPREWEEMRRHPELGWKILGHLQGLSRIADAIRFHHERPDGLGYPLKLKGEEIPLLARIIAVADTYDAMTSDRPYRQALSPEAAYAEIVRNRGSQFDEKVVDGFVRAFKLEGWAKAGKRTSREAADSRR